jgi:2-methylcitrate dehydratase PrpD
MTSAVDHILDFAWGDWDVPEAAVRTFLLDTIAVGLAGSTAPGAEGVLATAQAMGTGDEARLLGLGAAKLPAPGAAMVNAFHIHCLEWDAVHEPAVVHALSVVTAAVMAVCDRRGGVSPRAAAQALAIGVDIASGLGLAATTGLRFFRPATAGVMGAALACARLEGLSRAQAADVLGLAYSQAAGTMQAHVEGSIALPLQIALAARAAITAVDLVRHGLTGPHDVLEGPFGYFKLFESEGDLTAYGEGLGSVWRIAEISHKPYPSGRASHATLSALEAWALDPKAVTAITAHVPPLIHRLIGRPWVDGMSTAYARLCLPFLASLMITDKCIDPRRFTPASFADPALRALGAKVQVVVDGNPDPNALSPQRVEANLSDGRSLVCDIPATLGAPANPLSWEAQLSKVRRCNELAAVPLGPAALQSLIDDPLAFLVRA